MVLVIYKKVLKKIWTQRLFWECNSSDHLRWLSHKCIYCVTTAKSHFFFLYLNFYYKIGLPKSHMVKSKPINITLLAIIWCLNGLDKNILLICQKSPCNPCGVHMLFHEYYSWVLIYKKLTMKQMLINMNPPKRPKFIPSQN